MIIKTVFQTQALNTLWVCFAPMKTWQKAVTALRLLRGLSLKCGYILKSAEGNLMVTLSAELAARKTAVKGGNI